jgi:hypothetical protein
VLYRGDKMRSEELYIFLVVIIFVVDGIRTLEKESWFVAA